MMIGFGPSIENVVTNWSPISNSQFQQASVGNDKKMNQDHPYPLALLKCEDIFFVVR
jgi:hypothetical protein